jgi:hypothetical protein
MIAMQGRRVLGNDITKENYAKALAAIGSAHPL